MELPELRVHSNNKFVEFQTDRNLDLSPISIDTLQVNITKLCNQACLHCHVDSSPKRTEQMNFETVNKCLEVLSQYEEIKTLDITGGAPELNPHFDYMVSKAVKIGKHVIVRHNLTVTFDGNPQTGEMKMYIPEFFAKEKIEVVSSLPYYQEYFTDKQRGRGVFNKSIESLKLLNNEGYGKDDTGLIINLVYNPIGSYLPPPQKELEIQFKKELKQKYGIEFNNLYTITNMPIHRFKEQLIRSGGYEQYMQKLINAYNPVAAEEIMCRSILSVSYDGKLFDCDFNQMLEMQIGNETIYNFDIEKLLERKILFNSHCFGCTAGSGSSCVGATT